MKYFKAVEIPGIARDKPKNRRNDIYYEGFYVISKNNTKLTKDNIRLKGTTENHKGIQGIGRTSRGTSDYN